MDAPSCTSLCKGVGRPLQRAITIWSKSRTILAKWEKKDNTLKINYFRRSPGK
jgi:hypothetical protein